MNEMRPANRKTEEMARIRSIVASRPYPDFVSDFDIRAGSYDDETALWITLKLTGDDSLELKEMEQRAGLILSLQDSIHDDLAAAGVNHFPFFRVAYSSTPHH